MTQDIRDIRRLFDIRQVLTKAGVDARRKWMVCPLPQHPHKNYTPSFSIFMGDDGVERFMCHGICQAHGDVIDLAGYLWVKGYNPQNRPDVSKAIDMLQLEVPMNLSLDPPWLNAQVLDQDAHRKYIPISETAREYAHSRGLDDGTILKFHLGGDDTCMTIPTFEAEILVSLKKRALHAAGLRYRFWMEAGSRKGLFNFDRVVYAQGPVFYVKAEIPAMLLDQGGYQACAPTTGEGGFLETWRTALAFTDLIIVGDNDPTGREQAEARSRDMQNSMVVYPPETFKDIDEWILADPPHAWEMIGQWALAASAVEW